MAPPSSSSADGHPLRSALSPDLQRHGHWNDLPADFAKPSQPSRKIRRPQRAAAPVPAPPAPPSAPYLPSPALTPNQSDSERVPGGQKTPDRNRQSPGESGTEADDETPKFTHALPAPPLRPRKGLRSGEDDFRPTPSPKASLTLDYFGNAKSTSAMKGALLPQTNPATDASWLALWQCARRVVEVLSLLGLGLATVSAACSLSLPDTWHQGVYNLLCLYIFVILAVYCFHPVRLVASGRRLSIPLAADPAPLLYPVVLPVLVAVSVSFELPAAVLPNVILALASIPSHIVPAPEQFPGPNVAHWAISVIPLVASKSGYPGIDAFSMSAWSPDQAVKPSSLSEEQLLLLYPLHQLFLQPLKYLTSSSLLASEVQLLSVALINVLLLAASPQMLIWKYIIWIGAFGVLLFCSQVLRWNVALERIPHWRFRRAGQVVQASRTFLSTLADGLQSDGIRSTDDPSTSEGDQEPSRRLQRKRSTASVKAESHEKAAQDLGVQSRPKRKRGMSSSMHAYLSMTQGQASLRKFAYTTYTYVVILGLVLGPVRSLIQIYALGGAEPFGWAIGYLLGDWSSMRTLALNYDLESWVMLRPNPLDFAASPYVDGLRYETFGPANTRLLIFSYFAAVLGAGIGMVLYLSTSVEVDTRRKVFHGTMVALLLPTAFIDPKFLSLGLILVLTVFLLLEVLRAAQVKPLSKPLARFLAPYVDGRDLRGPIVVSHIFLLIGCAIPLWLSLASIKETRAREPWQGWEAQSRDVSMVAGVVCVGMGDAAASLIGRRYGRHKWPWRGGKSLEGSLAFATAVAIGLLAAKIWLQMGGWRQTWHDDGIWRVTVLKAFAAGGGASLSEAVLTGCNDNVVVPVILWLLVRSVKI